jgi:hypothetical protein
MANARKKPASPRPSASMNRTKKAAEMLTGIPVEYRQDLPQEEKISNALALMLNDSIGEGAPLAECRTVLATIVLAWNISLLPATARANAMRELFATMHAEEAFKRAFVDHVESLIARKQEQFPQDRRFIVSHEVSRRKGGLHVTAAAFIPSQRAA